MKFRRRVRLSGAVVIAVAAIGVLANELRTPLQQDLPYAPSQKTLPQRELMKLTEPLDAAGAAHAEATYIPGFGAVVVADVVRGPNATSSSRLVASVTSWGEGILATYGPGMVAVPRNQIIALSLDFYDFSGHIWRQLLLESRAGTVIHPATYAIWLDGRLARAPLPISSMTGLLPNDSLSPVLPMPAVSLTHRFLFTGRGAIGDWRAVRGAWSLMTEGYNQTRIDDYDFITLYKHRLAPKRYQVRVRYIAGFMGGGLIFNARSLRSKANSQMISYSESGRYLEWGYYNRVGIFELQGGRPVPSGADRRWHTIDVQLVGNTYTVSLDGVVLDSAIPLVDEGPGYVGLLASRSHVVFADAALG